VHVHLSYRDDDESGFALRLRRELKRVAADVTVTGEPILPGKRPGAVPRGAIMLMLVGTRWLRPASSQPLYFDDARDPLRWQLETAIADGVRIIPVTSQVPLATWPSICAHLPKSLGPLAHVNAVEIRAQSFSSDLQSLLTSLRGPDRSVPWTEAGQRTLIRLEAEPGGALKWWSSRNIALRVFVDDAEVGGLVAWAGRCETEVEPGRHAVQIREGPMFKSGVVTVEVARGATVTLVCRRNILTGTVSLSRGG